MLIHSGPYGNCSQCGKRMCPHGDSSVADPDTYVYAEAA